MNIYIFSHAEVKIPDSEKWLDEHQYNLLYYTSDEKANYLFSCKKADLIFTIGDEDSDYKTLMNMPLYIRRKWVHVVEIEKLTPSLIDSCFTAVLKEFLGPTISVFTSAYRSGDKINRPFDSLLKQSTREWEWIILDDSPEEDKDDTWNRIKALAERDCRIRVYKQKGNDGYIGSVKHITASMARGLYVLELDHDDELLPTALEAVITTFEKNPEVDMVGSDCSEIYEGTLANHSYCPGYGHGRHGYYIQWYQNRWVNVSRNGPLDRYTIRRIVGVVNHLRAWRKSTYDLLRGHDFNLNVVDDYELIVRTFLTGKMARIPEFLYVQYRNQGGNNFTFIRINLIQKLVGILSNMYDEQIHKRLLELGLPDFKEDEFGSYGSAINANISPPSLYLSHLPDPTADVVLDLHPKRVSIVLTTYNQAENLKRAVKSVLDQDMKDWVLYIIGDNCPSLHKTMEENMMHDSRIRYWNLEEKRGEGGVYCRNYALKVLATTDYIAYLADDKYWLPDHLSTLYTALTNDKEASYALASFKSNTISIICKKPDKFRVDGNCILHKRSLLEKYNYWNTRTAVGFANDFELVSRWVQGREKYVATKVASVVFNETEEMMLFLYNKYNDQESPTVAQPLDSVQGTNTKSALSDIRLMSSIQPAMTIRQCENVDPQVEASIRVDNVNTQFVPDPE